MERHPRHTIIIIIIDTCMFHCLQVLTRPLVALCDFQIQHGAAQHHSREYKIENGLWTKPLPRAVRRRLEQREGKPADTCDGTHV